MDQSTFDRIFKRIEYFYDIHMYSYHVQIANLAAEEYVILILEIIQTGGWERLKERILNLQNRKFQIRLLTLLTPIDLVFAKSAYKKFRDQDIFEYISSPMIWNNFVDKEYLDAAKKVWAKAEQSLEARRKEWYGESL